MALQTGGRGYKGPAASRLGGGGAATAQNIFGRGPMAEFAGGQGLIIAVQWVWG